MRIYYCDCAYEFGGNKYFKGWVVTADNVRDAEEVAKLLCINLMIDNARCRCKEIDHIIGGMIMLNDMLIEHVGVGKGSVYRDDFRNIKGKEVSVEVYINGIKSRRKGKAISNVLADEILREVVDSVLPRVDVLMDNGKSLDINMPITPEDAEVMLVFDGDGWDVSLMFYHKNKYNEFGDNTVYISSTIGKIGEERRRTYVKKVELGIDDRITVDMLADIYKTIEVKVINQDVFNLLAELFIDVLKAISRVGSRAEDIVAMYMLYP